MDVIFLVVLELSKGLVSLHGLLPFLQVPPQTLLLEVSPQLVTKSHIEA